GFGFDQGAVRKRVRSLSNTVPARRHRLGDAVIALRWLLVFPMLRVQSALPARHPWQRARLDTARPVLPPRLERTGRRSVAGAQRSPASGAIVWTTLPSASRNSMAP